MQQVKPQINYQDFSKIDIRVGTIIDAEEIPNSEKLLKLDVDFGELGKKQILSGIKKWYSPQDLKGLQVCFVLNLEPRQMMGLVSEGMILATDLGDDSKPILLTPIKSVENGMGIR
jgi:methionine--tRNA ligase beta chain